MNKFKILILCITLILLTGCGKDKQQKLIEEYNITEQGFTCSYVLNTQSYTDETGKIIDTPESSGSKLVIQVQKQQAGISDYDEDNPLVVRLNINNTGFQRVELKDNMEVELTAHGQKYPFKITEDLFEDILNYHTKYGMCMDDIIACREISYIVDYGDPYSPNYADTYSTPQYILNDFYSIYSINNRPSGCYYQVSLRHDETKESEKSINYSEMEESKSYCIITAYQGIFKSEYYSRINLYRSKNENFFRFDLAVNSNCIEDVNNPWKGQMYPIEKGTTFTTTPYYFPASLARGSFLSPNYTITIPDDQIPLLYPDGGGFPKEVYMCELKNSIGSGRYDMKLYVNKPESAAQGECQKSRFLSVSIEEGFASGRAESYKAEPDCEGIFGGLTKEIQSIFNVFKIAAPILILVLSIIDFVRATIQQDKDEMKVAFSKLIKRLILAVILFLLPVILGLVLQWSGSTLSDPLCSIR